MAAAATQQAGRGANRAPPPQVRPPAGSVLQKLSSEDRAILEQVLSEPPLFVDHPDLSKPGVELDLFGVEGGFASARATRFAVPVPVVDPKRASSARVPALSIEQERLLFLRLNYARREIAAFLSRLPNRSLSYKAARTLIAWADREQRTRDQIVQLNLPLVLAMAKRTRLSGVDFNEMISEGNMALLRSVNKFDCGRGFKFSTYACRAILKSFSRVAMRASRYRGTFPTEYDPAIEKSDFLEKKREDVEESCVDELKSILTRNLAELTSVEQTVIKQRFALETPAVGMAGPKTLEQVGDLIGVTKERVRQIQNKALQKIRTALEDRYLAA